MEEEYITLMREYEIGYHTKKEKTLVKTIETLPSYIPPYQIFLGGPQNTKMSITDEDVSSTLSLVREKNAKIYVHSQYIINLSNDEPYVSDLLIKNLQYAKQAGFKGVVVHTGKYTSKEPKLAIDIMYKNLSLVLDHATSECPILLETPSGQGTETLTDCKEFVDFVKRFNSECIRICVDTCHVFASGYDDPLEYIQYIQKIDKNLLKLVHYNDSKTSCGSCLDRHELIGNGHIGFEKMKKIAEYCHSHKISMVYEG
jgi:deoxyribonuclease-4